MIDNLLIRKLVRNVKDYGAAVAARKTGAALLRPIYCRTTFRIYRIDLVATATPPPDLKGLQLAQLRPDDSETIEKIERQAEWMRGQVGEALRRGALCLCLLSPRGLAAFNLVSFTSMSMPLVRLSLPLRAGEAWSNQITVARSCRRQGLASQLRFAMFEELRQRGIRRFYGGTLRSNVASLRLSRRVGLREIVDIEYTKVLNRERRTFRRLRSHA